MAIRRWERGENAPRSDVVPALADALGVTIDELYASDDDGEEDALSLRHRALGDLDQVTRDLRSLQDSLGAALREPETDGEVVPA